MTRLSRRVDDRPAFQFYVKDWLTDIALVGCSYESKGVWIDLLCYMWLAPERGKIDTLSAQKLIKMPTKAYQKIIKELSESGVCELIKEGDNSLILCRKMNREWKYEREISEVRSLAGSAKREQKANKRQAKREQKGGASTSSSSSTSSSTSINRVSSEEDTLVRAGARTIDLSAQDIVSIWNGFARDFGLASVKDMTEERKRKLKARLIDKSFSENFSAALPKIAASDFLRGLSKASSWRASFDWLIANGTNVIKILEGEYDNINPKDRSHDVMAAIKETTDKVRAMGVE